MYQIMNPTYLRLASDLHLEGFLNQSAETLEQTFLPGDPRDSESFLMLAGDISSNQDQLFNFLQAIEGRFLKVFFCPGNHEFYRHDFNNWNHQMSTRLAELDNTNFVTGDTEMHTYDSFRVVLGTLWASGGDSKSERAAVSYGLNDFRVIHDYLEPDGLFTVDRMTKINKSHRDAIEKYIDTPFNGKTIVMTHHLPSFRLCHPRFGYEINGGFASDCDYILAKDNGPDIWVFGHSHDQIDTELWGCRVVCNPAGYRGEWNSVYNNFMLKPVFVDLKE